MSVTPRKPHCSHAHIRPTCLTQSTLNQTGKDHESRMRTKKMWKRTAWCPARSTSSCGVKQGNLHLYQNKSVHLFEFPDTFTQLEGITEAQCIS